MRLPYALAVVLAFAVTVAAGLGLRDVTLGPPLVAALSAFLLLLYPYFLFGLTDARPRQGWLLVGALLVPYLLYSSGTGVFAGSALARLVAFIAVPTLLVYIGRKRRPPGLFDVLAVLAIWLPFDFRLLEGIWVWPEGQGSYGYQAVLAVDLAVLLFVVLRRIEGVGYRFRLARTDARVILVNFLGFAVIAIPLGLLIRFIEFQPRSFELLGFLGSFVAILLFIAIPEELLFRGLIQNSLQVWWGRGWVSLLVASAIFGAAHLNNNAAPNFAYALMATVAGIFYGRTFRESGNILAPALVHALVDATWRALFR